MNTKSKPGTYQPTPPSQPASRAIHHPQPGAEGWSSSPAKLYTGTFLASV